MFNTVPSPLGKGGKAGRWVNFQRRATPRRVPHELEETFPQREDPLHEPMPVHRSPLPIREAPFQRHGPLHGLVALELDGADPEEETTGDEPHRGGGAPRERAVGKVRHGEIGPRKGASARREAGGNPLGPRCDPLPTCGVSPSEPRSMRRSSYLLLESPEG